VRRANGFRPGTLWIDTREGLCELIIGMSFIDEEDDERQDGPKTEYVMLSTEVSKFHSNSRIFNTRLIEEFFGKNVKVFLP
jgi:hypothetical protein